MIRKSRFVIILALALILPATMMMLLAMSAVVLNAAPSRPEVIQVHDAGTQVADNLPTPGAPNKYYRKPGK